MTQALVEPITREWTTEEDSGPSSERTISGTARGVSAQLALVDLDGFETPLLPYLAAAAIELAVQSDVPFRLSSDDVPLALHRAIARVSMSAPDAGGPHTALLARILDGDERFTPLLVESRRSVT